MSDLKKLGEEMISDAKKATPVEDHKLLESFLALSKMHFRAIKDTYGDEVAWGIAMILMGPHTPRTFAQDHVACICCTLREVKGEDCMALKMCQEVTEFADEAGHPEWVDGDVLEREDLHKV